VNLTENAATWWRHVYDENTRLRRNWQWTDFIHNLREQFRPIDIERAARNRINNLRQTNSVSNYINNFKSLIVDIPSMAEADRLDYFLRGLKPDIQERVAQIKTYGSARTFGPTTNSGSSASTPIQIDAIRRTRLSATERDQLRRTGGCFFCRELGHLARNCPKKKKRMTIAAVEVDDEEAEKDNA